MTTGWKRTLTLIELLAAAGVIAALLALVLPRFLDRQGDEFAIAKEALIDHLRDIENGWSDADADAMRLALSAIRHSDAEVRQFAAAALGRRIHFFGGSPVPGTWEFAAIPDALKLIIPALIDALGDEDSGVRIHAANALAPIGEAAAAAIPALIRALDDAEPRLRIYAATALGNMGTAAEDAIPALTDLSNGSATQAAQAARDAIEKIEGKSEVSGKTKGNASKDESPWRGRGNWDALTPPGF